jgi:hypothetical protein
MDNTSKIREHMPVVCSYNGQFGTVDKAVGQYIKLTKDDAGQHHWIPAEWVTKVDQHVHVDRPWNQAMREWKSVDPSLNQSQEMARDSAAI